MSACLTGRIKKIIPLQREFEIIPFDNDHLSLFRGTKDFPSHCLFYLSSVHHPLAGDTDQRYLAWLKSFFKRKGSDSPGITPFDH
jgi:hypothetical protein